MVKITGPLMSNSASGKIGPRLVFSKRASGQQVRFQKAQKDKKTLPQFTNRGLYGIAFSFWNGLPTNEKAVYKDLAKLKNMSGYNYFMKLALNNPKEYLGLEAYWSFNETTGATVSDHSKNNRPLTLKPTFPTLCPTRIDSYNEEAGKALFFSTDNNFCTSTSFALTPPFLTFSFISNTSYNNDFLQIFLSDATQSGITGFLLFYRHRLSNNLAYQYANGSSAVAPAFNNYFLGFDGKFIHTVITIDYSAKVIKAYRNGELFLQTTRTDTMLFPDLSRIKYIGKYNTASHQSQNISLDDFCIFNKILNPAQIKSLYKFLFKK